MQEGDDPAIKIAGYANKVRMADCLSNIYVLIRYCAGDGGSGEADFVCVAWQSVVRVMLP